jgi:hypothetical protein
MLGGSELAGGVSFYVIVCELAFTWLNCRIAVAGHASSARRS